MHPKYRSLLCFAAVLAIATTGACSRSSPATDSEESASVARADTTASASSTSPAVAAANSATVASSTSTTYAPAPAQHKSHTGRWWLAALIIIVLLALAGYAYWRKKYALVTADPGYAPPSRPPAGRGPPVDRGPDSGTGLSP